MVIISMAKSHGLSMLTNMGTRKWRNGTMNDALFRTLFKKYEAIIEDSLYKINSFNENNIIIPEHIDITGEIDKLLQIIAEAEDKLSVMRKYYGKKETKKEIL